MPNCLRNSLLIAFSLVLLIQGAMPAGYMPASFASGWPVMLCPEGLPAGFLEVVRGGAQSAAHHAGGHQHLHHDLHEGPAQSTEDGQHQHNGGPDYCPLGSSLHAPALIDVSAPAVMDQSVPVFASSSYQVPQLPRRPATSHPRAPPIV